MGRARRLEPRDVGDTQVSIPQTVTFRLPLRTIFRRNRTGHLVNRTCQAPDTDVIAIASVTAMLASVGRRTGLRYVETAPQAQPCRTNAHELGMATITVVVHYTSEVQYIARARTPRTRFAVDAVGNYAIPLDMEGQALPCRLPSNRSVEGRQDRDSSAAN